MMYAVWCGRMCSWGQRAASLGSSSAVWLAGWILKCSYLIGLSFGKRAVEDDRAPSLCGRLLSGTVLNSLERPGVAIFGSYMALWLVASASHWKWKYSIGSQAMGGPLKMPSLSAFPMPQATTEGDYIRLFFYVAGTWSRPRVIGRFCFSSWQTRKMIPSPFYFSPSFIYRFNPARKPLPRFHKRHFGHSIREYKKLVQGTSMIGLTLSFSLFLPLSLSFSLCVCVKEG